MDVAATIAELTGIPLASQEETGAISYQRLLAGEGAKRPLLLENPTGWALRMADWKAIAPTNNDMPHLFNLRTDPHERHPLRDAHLRHELTLQAKALRAKADQRAAQWEESDSQVDDLVLERLRALGYW
jgi:arylsulfatase A-like enzyme